MSRSRGQIPSRCLLFALLAACGCQQSTQPVTTPTYPVTGSLTINGQPAAGASLKLYQPEMSGRMPTAIVRHDGSFSFSYLGAEDGAPAGKYSVLVMWMVTPRDGGLPVDRLGLRHINPNQPVAQVVVLPGSNHLPPIRLKAILEAET